MNKHEIENLRTWPRKLSTALGGGLSTALYGGLSSAICGGMSTSSSNIYISNIPPWPYFVAELEQRGYDWAVEIIQNHLSDFLWQENYFRH